MFSRKFAALLFVAMLMVSSQPSNANDFQKVLNAGKKAALKQVGRTLQKRAVSATSSQKASATIAKTATKASSSIPKEAATSATTSSSSKAKSATAKIQEKIAAEAGRNAKKYGNKYLQKGERQLTKFLK